MYYSKCTKPLLERKISLCEKNDDFGWTPLHYSIKVYNAEAVGMILERKRSAAYIHAGSDKEWTTGFHIAARGGNIEMMKGISKKCPDCWEMMNSKGQNVLHEAVVSNRFNVVQHIKSSNQFDHLVHQKDQDGNTPLYLELKRPKGHMELEVSTLCFCIIKKKCQIGPSIIDEITIKFSKSKKF